jgi:type II secretory pathway component GspD/PulD (secretin)
VFQVGFTLVVIPRIMDGWVDLQMRPSLRIITGHTPDGTPQIATRAVEMRVPVREGHTLTVAQMIDQRTIKTVSGIPIMSRIPIIGVLFRTTRNTTTESGLTIFVTPKVMP